MQRSKEGSQDFADTKFRAVAWIEPTGSSECQAGRLTVHFNILVLFFFFFLQVVILFHVQKAEEEYFKCRHLVLQMVLHCLAAWSQL